MKLGCHVNRDWVAKSAADPRPSIVEHIEAATAGALEAGGVRLGLVQVFVGGPHNRVLNLGKEEAAALKVRATAGLKIVAHSSYACHPWKGDPSAAEYIRSELRVCQAAGISGLVVHLPKLPVDAAMKYLPRLFEPEAPDVRVYFETPANVPAETYYETPEKLAEFLRQIRGLDPELVRFGLCVDTAHLWVSGVDLRRRADAEAWLARLELRIPELFAGDPTTPRVIFHLNDSERARGKGPDAHAPLAKGHIWGEFADRPEESGIGALADFARLHGTWLILERKPNAALAGDYHILRRLLPELAAE